MKPSALLLAFASTEFISSRGVLGSVATDSIHSENASLGPNDLRAIKLSVLRKPELGLKLTGIDDFISRYNDRIDVGKVDPSNGLIGVGDLYDITLIGLLCEISSGHIDHIKTNTCKKIEAGSIQKTRAIDDMTYILTKAHGFTGKSGIDGNASDASADVEISPITPVTEEDEAEDSDSLTYSSDSADDEDSPRGKERAGWLTIMGTGAPHASGESAPTSVPVAEGDLPPPATDAFVNAASGTGSIFKDKEYPQDRVTLYTYLGIPRTATASEIKKAYLKMALKYHPDKHSGKDSQASAGDMFRNIGEANRVLSKATWRDKYDRMLELTDYTPISSTEISERDARLVSLYDNNDDSFLGTFLRTYHEYFIRRREDIESLIKAANDGESVNVEEILSKGVDINSKNKGGYTALCAAAQEGHVQIIQLLLARGADVNIPCEFGIYALMWAINYDHVLSVENLLDAGADLTATDEDGHNALFYAASDGNVAIVNMLLAKGADIDQKVTKEGISVLKYLEKKPHEGRANRETIMGILRAASDAKDAREFMNIILEDPPSEDRQKNYEIFLEDLKNEIAANEAARHLYSGIYELAKRVFELESLPKDGKIDEARLVCKIADGDERAIVAAKNRCLENIARFQIS